MNYITLGKIVSLFGIKGEVKVYSSSDFSATRYKKNNKVYLFNEQNDIREEVSIATFRKSKNLDIISFKEFSTATDVEKFINCLVQIKEECATLPKGFYRYCDLELCDVYDENNTLLGHVKTVEEYASYKTLRIERKAQKDFFVPFVKAFIKSVDLENHKIIIHVLEGLL